MSVNIALFGIPKSGKKKVIQNCKEISLKNKYTFTVEHYCFPEKFGNRKFSPKKHSVESPHITDEEINDRFYSVVFKEKMLKNYDLVIYLDIDPSIIQEKFNSYNGHTTLAPPAFDEIRSWQMFEINQLENICRNHNLPLYYVYNIQQSEEEIEVILDNYLKTNKKAIQNM